VINQPGCLARLFLFLCPVTLIGAFCVIIPRPWRRRGSCGRKFFPRHRGNSSREAASTISGSLYIRSIFPSCHSPDMYSCSGPDFGLSCIPYFRCLLNHGLRGFTRILVLNVEFINVNAKRQHAHFVGDAGKCFFLNHHARLFARLVVSQRVRVSYLPPSPAAGRQHRPFDL